MAATTLASGATAENATLCACGCGKALSGKQTKFATRPCAARLYDQIHPRINRGPDGRRPGRLKDQILAFLREHPGEHTEQQIADAIHGFSHSVGARLSELRRANEPIEVRRGPQNIRLYRLAGVR